MKLSWQVAHQCLPASGETECGDLVVHREAGGEHLIAVVDALGHGAKAAEVAAMARQHLEALPWPSALTSEAVIEGLHGRLRGSRGAAATVCLLRGQELDGCGVGNVELRSVGSAVPVMMSPGVLGQRVLRLHHFTARLSPQASLFFFSDGISSRAPFTDLARLAVAEACGVLAREHRKPHDDGSVLVARLESTTHVPGN